MIANNIILYFIIDSINWNNNEIIRPNVSTLFGVQKLEQIYLTQLSLKKFHRIVQTKVVSINLWNQKIC